MTTKSICEICKEKDKRIHAILKAYKRDKKFYWTTILVLMGIVVVLSTMGKEGIELIVKGVLEKWI
jgi:hypothetical protein